MKRLNTAVSIVFLLCVTAPVLAQSSQPGDDGTIILGRHFSFILKAPPGWILDGSIAKSEGVEAVLFREGSSWKSATTVMYARVIFKVEGASTIEQVIADDEKEFLKLSSESKVSESPSLKTGDNREARVRGFYDAANKNYESVAFIDLPKVVVILALSSRSKDEFEKSLPVFKALVGSYFFVSVLASRRNTAFHLDQQRKEYQLKMRKPIDARFGDPN